MRILQHDSDTFWLQIFIIIAIVSITIYWLLKPYNKYKENQLRQLHINILALHSFNNYFKNCVNELRKKYYSATSYLVLYGIGFHCNQSDKDIIANELEICANKIIKNPERTKELESYKTKLNDEIFSHFKAKIAPRLQEELDTIQFSDLIFNIIKDNSSDNKSLDLSLFLDKFSTALNIPLSKADNIISRIANTEPSLREGSPNLSLIKIDQIERKILLGDHWGYKGYTNQYQVHRSLWDIFRYQTTNNFIGFKYEPPKLF